MSRTDDGTALTTTETVLFASNTSGVTADGVPARVYEVQNDPGNAAVVLVQVAPIHGAADWFPVPIGGFRQFGAADGSRGLITSVRAKMKSGSGTVSGGVIAGS